jgi:hypothetical protein
MRAPEGAITILRVNGRTDAGLSPLAKESVAVILQATLSVRR